MSTHEQVMAALFTLASNAYAFSKTGRRLKLWGDVPLSDRPALYQFEGGRDSYQYRGQEVLRVRVLEAQLFVYTDAKDRNTIGIQQVNAILDAFDTAFAPSPGEMTGRQTLGGLVHSCRIEGEVFKDPGDLDGDGLLIVPIKIVMP